MKSTFLEWLGNENPQLVRELKGRLKARNLAIATAVSLLSQLLLLMSFYGQTGSYKIYPPYSSNSAYNYSECIKDAFGQCAIDWSRWWQDLFGTSLWSLPLILLIGGVYSIVSDFAREEKRGTLNFIRLSPQSSQSILTGKILGVPILIYLGTALAIPLQLYCAKQAGISLGFIACWYALLGVCCGLFYSASILYVLMGGFQAWLGSILAWAAISPFIPMLNFFLKLEKDDEYAWQNLSYMNVSEWRWFYLPIGEPLAFGYSFILLTLGLVTYGIWQLANRRFRNPSVTLLSKRQSYIAVAGLQVWLLGFSLPELTAQPSQDYIVVGLCFLFLLTPVLFLGLISALTPQRQTLQDWARYEEGKREKGEGRIKSFFWNRTLVKDLIWGEKSPAFVAIALNMLIAAAIWVPWILLLPDKPSSITPPSYDDYKIKVFQGLILTLNIIAIAAMIVQLMLFAKTKKPSLWAAIAMGSIIALPLSILGFLSISPEKNPLLWMFSVAPVVGAFYASTTTIFLTILGQWSIFGLLCVKLSRQLRKAGESASKALLVGSH